MTVEKAQVRVDVVHHVGVEIDDLLQAAEIHLHVMRGAVGESARIDGVIRKEILRVKALLEAGRVASHDVDLVVRHLNACLTEVKASTVLQESVRQEGRVDALRGCVSRLKVLHQAEADKIRALEAHKDAGSPEPEEPIRRTVGTHPGPTIKMRRSRKKR